MSTITLTVNLNDGQAVPLLEDLFSTMTIEDKRKLASQIAYNYFAGKMADYRHDAYGREPPQATYLKQLANEVVGQIGKQIAEDPVMSEGVKQIMANVTTHRDKFVQQAVTTVLSKMIGDIFTRSGENEAKLFDTAFKVQMLEQKVGVS